MNCIHGRKTNEIMIKNGSFVCIWMIKCVQTNIVLFFNLWRSEKDQKLSKHAAVDSVRRLSSNAGQARDTAHHTHRAYRRTETYQLNSLTGHSVCLKFPRRLSSEHFPSYFAVKFGIALWLEENHRGAARLPFHNLLYFHGTDIRSACTQPHAWILWP